MRFCLGCALLNKNTLNLRFTTKKIFQFKLSDLIMDNFRIHTWQGIGLDWLVMGIYKNSIK